MSQQDRSAAGATESRFKPGSIVDHFRIIRLAGQGGMGDVYLSRDIRLGRKVALKMINVARAESPQEVQRFLFEARTTARFNHPHIVTVYAAGVHEGFPYLALEFLDGENLRQRMESAQLSVKEVMRVCLAVAEALCEAHEHGVLHRDLKPENVLIPKDGRVRVVDFGLAKVVSDALGPPTAQDTPAEGPGAAMASTQQYAQSMRFGLQGTPSYMSPEQWMGKDVSEASDIWALGVMLFELVVGRRPFEAPTPLQLAAVVANVDPAPTLDDALGAPQELKDLVARCLEKSAADRPSGPEVVEALQALLSEGTTRRRGAQNPFRGLQAFGEKHADLFYGRDAEVDAFLERMREEPVLPVVGPSGAGKSSFVMAGVVPRLREQGPWLVMQLRPGSEPFRNLANRLDAMITVAGEDSLSLMPTLDLGPEGSVEREALEQAAVQELHAGVRDLPLDQQLRAAPQVLSLLLDRLATRVKSRVLLFVDQLEELYTLCEDDSTRRAFMSCICAAADDPLGPARVIFTVREDFFSRLGGGQAVRAALSHVTVMRTPEPEALEEILVRPVEVRGYAYQDQDLVQEMIQAAGEEQASLPLVQFAARLLWERRDRKARLLTRAAYSDMGGVAGALATHAEGVLKGLSAEDEQVVRDILLRLVTPQRTRRVLSWYAVLDGLRPGAEEVLGRLIEARLVSVRKSRVSAETELELAHESLVQTWGKLSRWIERSREDLAFLYDVGQSAELWEKRGSREEEVWQGEALAEGLRALRRCKERVPDPVVRFLEQGRRKQAQKVRRRRAVWGGVALAVVCVMLFLVYQKEQADEQRLQALQGRATALREGARASRARGDRLEARAKLRASMQEQDSPLARALWWRLSRDPLVWSKQLSGGVYSVSFSPDGRNLAVAGHNKIVHQFDVRTRRQHIFRGFPDRVMFVAYSPDGKLLAAGTWSGTVVIRNLANQTTRELVGHKGAILSLAFGGNSRLLASGGKDRTIRVWDLGTAAKPRVLRGHKAGVVSVAFSPDGKLLASGSSDSTLRLWTAPFAGQSFTMAVRSGGINGVAFSPDGKTLASAGSDFYVRLWDVARRTQRLALKGHSSAVYSLSYDPKGRLLASGSYDKTIRIWDANTGLQKQVLRKHGDAVWGLAFSPDGLHLASGGRKKYVHLWRIKDKASQQTRRGHHGPVYGVAFSPDSESLATGGMDSTVRLWRADSGQQFQVLDGHTAQIQGVAFSPDGKSLASGSYDHTIRLWRLDRAGWAKLIGVNTVVTGLRLSPTGHRLASGSGRIKIGVWDPRSLERIHDLAGHTDMVYDVAFSPDGKHLASAGRDATIRLWDLDSGQQTGLLKGHAATVWGVAYGPDGESLASASSDGTVRLWDRTAGTSRVIERRPGRAYKVAFSPDGETLGVSRSDHTASLIKVADGSRRVLRGHRSEVNYIAFGHNGKLVATTSDDGTVRLWDTDLARPIWRAPVMLTTPPQIYTHQGWISLDAAPAPPATPRKWRVAVEQRAESVSQSVETKLLCMITRTSQLEMWDQARDQRVLSESLQGARQVVALAKACLVRLEREVRVYTQRGMSRRLAGEAVTMAWDRGRVLVADLSGVRVLDLQGRQRATFEIGQGVTAMTHVGKWLVAGFRDGNIELVPTTAGQRKPRFYFEDVPSSPVVRLLPGPPGTLMAGYANGVVGIWNMANGVRLHHARLHGPVVHLLLKQSKLYAATELGDHLTLDLGPFYDRYCALLRQVWQEVPVVWHNGLPRLKKPPTEHRCAAGP